MMVKAFRKHVLKHSFSLFNNALPNQVAIALHFKHIMRSRSICFSLKNETAIFISSSDYTVPVVCLYLIFLWVPSRSRE